ncbi:MAG TPA: ion channel [Methylocella sp.]|nr:ion channel [Methylocella sp.]
MRARPSVLRGHLGRARERLGDRLLTWLTVLLIFLTFVIVPLHASGLIVWEGYGLGIALVMAACVLGSSAGPWSVGVILAGVGLAIAGGAVLTGLLDPGAISGLTQNEGPRIVSELIYFSFVTLASTGYGGIVPIHPLPRSLCNLEPIIGQLYPATLLARLVTLELENRRG